MPDNLKALAMVLLIASFTFVFAKKVIVPTISIESFKRWRNAWFAITLIAFLSYNFWIYIIASGLFMIFLAKHEPNKLALFFALLFAVPAAGSEIPGFGGINYIIQINHLRLLALVILFPAFVSLLTSHSTLKFGKYLPDKILLTYLLVSVLLGSRGGELSALLRNGFYAFTDIFLPYYIASRALKQLDNFKETFSGFALASFLVAAIACFEFIKIWLLYPTLAQSWGLESGMGRYLKRGNNLRAVASLGHSVVLGYVMVVAMGFYAFLNPLIRSKGILRLGWVLLILGLFVTLSRGPWVGAAVFLVILIATGPYALKRLIMLSMVIFVSMPLISLIPAGARIINMLPFIGNSEKGSVEYREQLIDNSIIVIKRNPFFGSLNYLNNPEMQEMIQGEGIVDIVNTYIGITLVEGLVGLSLFVGFFLAVLSGIRRSMKTISDKTSELYLLGRIMTATLIAVLVIVFTVSSVESIPIIYWSLAGIGVAYINIVNRAQDSQQIDYAD